MVQFLVRKIPWRTDRPPTPVFLGFPGESDGKESTCNAGNLVSVPELGSYPGGGHGNPLQYSCLENPMDRGAWWAIVHRVTKGQTQLKWLHVHALARQDVETYRPLFSLTNMPWIPISCQAVCWGLKAFLSRVLFISDPSLKAAYFSSSWLLAGLDGANEVKP